MEKRTNAFWKNGWGKVAACTGLLAVFSLAVDVRAENWPQFRGPNRNGKTQVNVELQQKWPDQGPKKLWENDDLGFGFASAAVTEDMIYTTGLEDEKGYIYALELDGDLAWKASYGRGWSNSRRGTRTTPTVHDGKLYIMSGYGKAACHDADNGEEIWSVDTQDKFGARTIQWGITECPLVIDNMAIFSPGGKNAGVVALDADTGDTLWVCEDVNDKSGYCSPITVQRGGKTIIAQLMAKTFIGLEAETGELLWRVKRKPSPNYGVQAVPPVYDDGKFYITCGYGGEREQMFKLNADGTSVKRGWSDDELDVHHGGVILHEGFIYGGSHSNNRNKWLCVNLDNGNVAAKIGGVGKGSVTYANGMLYTYGKKGKMGLVVPDPENFRMVSSFRINKGKGPHWAHPSIADGRLYLRHGSYMFAYDIQAD